MTGPTVISLVFLSCLKGFLSFRSHLRLTSLQDLGQHPGIRAAEATRKKTKDFPSAQGAARWDFARRPELSQDQGVLSKVLNLSSKPLW